MVWLRRVIIVDVHAQLTRCLIRYTNGIRGSSDLLLDER